jgi:flagellar hook assembly protein FlgD
MVYNILGQVVRTLMNENQTAGEHKVIWDSKDEQGNPVASGVYLYKLVAGNFSESKKMLLLK